MVITKKVTFQVQNVTFLHVFFPHGSFHKNGTYIGFKKVFLIIYHSAKLSLLLPRRAAAQPFDRAEVACQQSSCFSLLTIIQHREPYTTLALMSLKGNQNSRRLNFLRQKPDDC